MNKSIDEKKLAEKIMKFIDSNNEGAALGIKNMEHWDHETVISAMIKLLNQREKDGKYELEWTPEGLYQ